MIKKFFDQSCGCLVVVIIIIGLIVFFEWRSGKFANKKGEEEKPVKEDKEALRIEAQKVMWKDDEKAIYLIAAKHGIDFGRVKPFYTDFLKKQEPLDYKILTTYDLDADTTVQYKFEALERMDTTLMEVSRKHHIGMDTLASFIFDYYLFIKENNVKIVHDNYIEHDNY